MTNIKNLGFKPAANVSSQIKISKRLTSAWAYCRQNNKTFNIVLAKSTQYGLRNAIKGIIYHEVIHTLPNCFNHGKEFKRIAEVVKKTYNIDPINSATYEAMYGKKRASYFKKLDDMEDF